MISGLASSRDQGSAFDTLRSQVTKSPRTNSKGASKATFLQAIENTMTDPADEQTMMCGPELVKNACAHLKSEHAHNCTGHRNSRTHAHSWAQKFKNACAHWHSTDLRGHDDPWTRRTRTALTGTEREASAHWRRESISAAALRTKAIGRVTAIGYRPAIGCNI